jgi:hypothetical protein
VLLSLKLQIALFLFAGIRRRGAHYLPRFLLWFAYQLADYTATYALGHLSIRGARPIVAFWASFLLLHLGGPDNITAYSLEDSNSGSAICCLPFSRSWERCMSSTSTSRARRPRSSLPPC